MDGRFKGIFLIILFGILLGGCISEETPTATQPPLGTLTPETAAPHFPETPRSTTPTPPAPTSNFISTDPPPPTTSPPETAPPTTQPPTTEPQTTTEPPAIPKEETLDVINASNQFALDLYSELKGDDGNIFFSPYSISTALVMTYEGARGQTAEEIQKVFHFQKNNSIRRTSFSDIINRLNKKDAPYKLSTANALWVQENYPILKEYIETVEKHYFGKATNLDFVGATEESRETINTWVEEQTNNKIKELFPPGTINEFTRFVLTNAIYFKGNWVKQFNKSLTMDEDFRIAPDKTVKVPMMRQTPRVTMFNYAETGDLQILELLYEGEDLSMLILLPKTDVITSLEGSLSLQNLSEWKNKLREQEVMVFIPKFTFETKYFMVGTLSEMGMPSAFAPSAADFSGIDGSKNLFISAVIHQAFVDVNEEGTEAAAATGVVGGITSVPPPPPVFRADHPFIFIIQERETGNILFMGRVSDPSR